MRPLDIVRTGYDAAAAAYTNYRAAHVEPELLELLDALCAETPPGSRVLDAGCGGGVVAALLSDRYDVVGVDLSMEQLRLARVHAPGVRLLCQDITTLGFPDECFAAMCSIWTIIHVPREEHLELLRNFVRMLRPGGLALLSFGQSTWEGTEVFFGAEIWWSHFDRSTSLGLVEQAGFEVLRVVDVDDRPAGGRAPFVIARRPRC